MWLFLLVGFTGSTAAGWWAVEWWTVRRPLRAPTPQGRELRLARIAEGRPPRYICTDCGRKIRKHGYNPSFCNTERPRDMVICDACILAYPDRDDWDKWMSFDLVSY